MLPFGLQSTTTATGKVQNVRKCEKCKLSYSYWLTREGVGKGSSVLFLDNAGAAERSEKSAKESLEKQLKNASDPVACPSCGWFQSEMQPAVQTFNARITAALSSCVGIGIFVYPLNHNVVPFWFPVGFVALFVSILIVALAYAAGYFFIDPNFGHGGPIGKLRIQWTRGKLVPVDKSTVNESKPGSRR